MKAELLFGAEKSSHRELVQQRLRPFFARFKSMPFDESGPDSGDEGDWSQSPLLSTSKEIRLQAIERLPALVDKLVEVAEEQVGKFKAAAAKAHTLAAAITEAK